MNLRGGLELQIITAQGELRFATLNLAQGVATIGRNAANDVVLPGAAMPDFAASLDFRGGVAPEGGDPTAKPFHLTALTANCVRVGGARLAAHASAPLALWDTFQVGDSTLVVMVGEETPPIAAPSAPPTATVPGNTRRIAAPLPPQDGAAVAAPIPQLGPPIADQLDDVLIFEISERTQSIEVTQTATWQITLINGSALVSQMQVHVEGWVDERWVQVAPATVNLNEGARQTVTVMITPPRAPGSLAGAHYLALVITSPTHPERRAQCGCTLVIAPYYDQQVGALTPAQHTLPYRKANAHYEFTVQNLGNGDSQFRIEATDLENGCRFNFPAEDGDHLGIREVQLAPAAATAVAIEAAPIKRVLIGNHPHLYSFRVNVTALDDAGAAMTLMGELKAKTLMGSWVLIVLALLTVLLVMFFFRPRINGVTFAYTAPSGEPVSQYAPRPRILHPPSATGGGGVVVGAGQNVKITWETDFASELSILEADIPNAPVAVIPDQDVKNGSQTLLPQVTNPQPGQLSAPFFYVLRAENWMSNLPLISFLGVTNWPIEINVVPASPPAINAFTVSTATVVLGDAVAVQWDVQLRNPGDTLMLAAAATGSPPATAVLPAATGTLVLAPGADTQLQLIANSVVWTGGTPAPTRVIGVTVQTPTPTPVPPPIIAQFDVAPVTLVAGDSITVTYNVSRAVISSLYIAGLPTPEIPLTPGAGRQVAPIPQAGEFAVSLRAVNLPAGVTDPSDPHAVATAASRQIVAAAPTPTATPTTTPLPTATPQVPVITALVTPSDTIVLGSTVTPILTWSVVGDMDVLHIFSPDDNTFNVQTTLKQGSIPLPTDKTRTFVLTPILNQRDQQGATAKLNVLTPTPVPPPTPAPSATPTPVPSPTFTPMPQVQSFTATSLSGATERKPDENGIPVFGVGYNDVVDVAWVVANAQKVTIDQIPNQGATITFADRLPADRVTVNLQQKTRFVLKPNGNVCADLRPCTIIVDINQVQRANPPTNLVYSGGATTTDPVSIGWYYSPADTQKIVGFRVYRAPSNSANFQRVADEGTLNPQARAWVDATVPACGQSYYVVAVYVDPQITGNDQTAESDAGAPSYFTPPCP